MSFSSLLSPDEQEGVVSSVRKAIEVMLAQQNAGILDQFSLDNKESALNRLLSEMTEKHGNLSKGFEEKIDVIRREFSLDVKDSALSRLVTRVELSQKKISDEFSADNEASALNKLLRMLQETNSKIQKQLTLDDENSALNLMMRKLDGSQQEILKSHQELQTAFAELHARKKEKARSPRHGDDFENQLSELLAAEVQRSGDVFVATGTKVGSLPHCKKGDYVSELGPESCAPGARLVLEAKEDKSWDVKRALGELDEAMKNRQAQVGIFVFSKKTAPEGVDCFARYGNSIVIVWDADDPGSDIIVRSAYSLARALVIRDSKKADENKDALRSIDHSTRIIEKQIAVLDDILKMAQTVKSNGEKILDKGERIRKELHAQVEILDEQVGALNAATDGQ
ncbi:MAG TPA: hypothetical protein V6D22_13880 [Candidatus Obscuribacterales bacterium]